jgi:hypothetical protein
MAKSTAKSKETAIEKKDQEAAMMSFDYGDEAGQGYSPESAEDIQIPFILVLQALSPQVKSVEKGGLKGAEIGMLCNTVTSELSKSVRFIPAYSKKLYVEWITRKEGGGFVASHELDSEVVLALKKSGERGPYKTNDGKHEIIETQYLYCVEVDDSDEPTGGFFVVSFTSTKLASWRKWNTAVHTLRIDAPDGRKIQPPLYAHVVEMTTKEQTNKHGDFYNYVLAPAHDDMKKSLVGPQSNGFTAAKDLRALIESGQAKAAESTAGESDQADDDDGPDAF